MARQKNTPNAEQVAAFRALVKGLIPETARYVAVTSWYPDPEDGPGGEGSRQVKKLGPKRLARAAVEMYKGSTPEDIEYLGGLPTDFAGVLKWVDLGNESDWSTTRLMTLKDFNRDEEERERKACEGMAAQIVAKYKVKLTSLAFIAAVHRHYGRIADSERRFRTDPEVRMERWARASSMGNSEGFWSDNDYSSSLQHRAEEDRDRLIRYLHRYCPLLMARWEERRAARRQERQGG